MYSTSDCQPLFVKQKNGRYQLAQPEQVLAGARQAADALVIKGQSFNRPDVVKKFLIAKLTGYEHEVFACLFLDTQLRLIEFREMFHGTLNQASVYPREVARLALKLNAHSVLVSHNHPSGGVEPSQDDIVVTQQLKSALALIDVRLNDHILVASGHAVSFAEQGSI